MQLSWRKYFVSHKALQKCKDSFKDSKLCDGILKVMLWLNAILLRSVYMFGANVSPSPANVNWMN